MSPETGSLKTAPSTTQSIANRTPRFGVAEVVRFRRVTPPRPSYPRLREARIPDFQAESADRLRSYRAAMKRVGNSANRECGRWLNNRAENSHQPFRRLEGAMARFRDIKTLQKFSSVHASIHNHFNQERHLHNPEYFKLNRSAALAEWRQLAA